MKQEISALMDGELFEDEAEGLLDRVKRDSDAHKDWAVYHLIGDVLRQPEHIHCDLSTKVRERMRDEPTVLAPRGRAVKQRVRAVALSAAASLVAVGVVAWMFIPDLAMAKSTAKGLPPSVPVAIDIENWPESGTTAVVKQTVANFR